MRKIKILIFVFASLNSYSQEELIQNGDFEMYLPAFPTPDENIPCKWGEFSKVNPDWPGTGDVPSLNFLTEFRWEEISTPNGNNGSGNPDFFDSRYNCTTDNCSGGNYTNNCNADINKVGVPNNFYGTQYHRTTIPSGGFGRYVGIYSGWFASGMYSLALGREKGIKIKLKKPLKCGFVYTLRFYAVKKRGNQDKLRIRFGTGDDWNDGVKLNNDDKTIEVAVSQSGGSNNNEWQYIEIPFYVDEPNVQWFFIRAPKVPTPFHSSYILLDDFSLIDQCAVDFACDATLDVTTDEITTNHIHTPYVPLTFFNTESSKNIKIEIKTPSLNYVLRTIEITDPGPTIAWDGKGDLGNLLPNGPYKYAVTYGGACSCRKLEGTFVKIGDPQLFNVTYGTATDIGALAFHNLNNVFNFDLKIYNSSGALVYQRALTNPPDDIYWDGTDDAGNPIGGSLGCGNPVNFLFDLTVSNNCGSRFYEGVTFDQYCFGDITNATISNFNYVPQPKPQVVCQYSFDYSSYAKAPKPCCDQEIDLFLEDVIISGTQEFKLLHDIQAGPKVKIETNSDIKFLAGNEIRLLDGFYTAPVTEFLAKIEPCTRMMAEDGPIDLIQWTNFPDVTVENTITKSDVDSSGTLNVFPNPTSYYLFIQSEFGIYNIDVYDLTGKLISSESYLNSRFVKLDASKLLNGVYILQITLENGSVETRKVIKN